jgi:hypothetical protein
MIHPPMLSQHRHFLNSKLPMTLHYFQALIPLAIGIYLGLAWDSLHFRIPNFSFVLQPEYEVLTPSLVAEIEELRKRWDIRGMSIAVVKQDGGHEYNVWKTDTFGLGALMELERQ